MNHILEEPSVKTTFSSTGYIGAHWNNVKEILKNSEATLSALGATVDEVNKSVRLLDSVRRSQRLKSHMDKIGMYQQHIRSCKDIIQISLQATIL
jgi:hypothetical protein